MGVWSGTLAGMVHMVIVIRRVCMVIVPIILIMIVIGHMDNTVIWGILCIVVIIALMTSMVSTT